MRHKPNLINCREESFKIALGEGNARIHTTAFLAKRKRDPIPKFEGTGVVMCAGGLIYLREAFISISRLRATRCELPVQVWHLGPKELPGDVRKRFDHLRVEFVDAHEVRKTHPARQLYGWELKSYALQWSPFQHVLLLDSDCYPVRNPSTLFDSEQYHDYGAIMWPDIQHCRRDDKAFGFLGVRKPDGYMEVESGQMMIDKHRTWRALELCRWMNDFSEFWYRYFHGDKSTFDLAFLRTDTPYLLAPPCTWEGWGLSQKWLDGQPMFQHRMQVKRGFQGLAGDQVYASQFDRFPNAA